MRRTIEAKPGDVIKVCKACEEKGPHGHARSGGRYPKVVVRSVCRTCWQSPAKKARDRERERKIAAEKRRRKKTPKRRQRDPGSPRAIGDPRVAPARVVFIHTAESEGRRLAREKEEARAWRSFVGSHGFYKRGGAGRRKGREAS